MSFKCVNTDIKYKDLKNGKEAYGLLVHCRQVEIEGMDNSKDKGEGTTTEALYGPPQESGGHC
jgi:hypothetical protein